MPEDSFFAKIDKLNKSQIYPFHMPGHKRNYLESEDEFVKRYKMFDITEITDYDDLHDAQGIIKDIENKGAQLYNADECHILVNGSTSGILAAVSALIRPGKKILLNRNSHKSVYNAILLNSLEARYVYSKDFLYPNICGGVDPKDVRDALTMDSDIDAVYITSPTYEGIISDVEQIAEIAHEFGVPLIVDAAHGAHLPFSDSMGEKYNMVFPRADVVITSLHKTLNSPTQTAALLINGNLISKERIKKYLGVYQTSSPSYIMMGMIDNCFNQLLENKDLLFSNYEKNLNSFYKRVDELKCFSVLTPDKVINKNNVFGFDIGKIVISIDEHTKVSGCENGYCLLEKLYSHYGIHVEYASHDYILAMSSYMDSLDGLDKLVDALFNIEKNAVIIYRDKKEVQNEHLVLHTACNMKEAFWSATENVNYKLCENRISGDMIYAYPPGIPLVVPGEVISKEIIDCFGRYCTSNVLIKGMDTRYSIKVLL